MYYREDYRLTYFFIHSVYGPINDKLKRVCLDDLVLSLIVRMNESRVTKGIYMMDVRREAIFEGHCISTLRLPY